MRLLILSPSVYPEPGGLQRYTYSLAVSLARQGHKVHLLTLDDAEGFVSHNANLTCSTMRFSHSVANNLLVKMWQKAYLGLMMHRKVARFDPDQIICTWWDPFGYLALIVSRLRGIPIICVAHGQETMRLPQDFGARQLKQWLRDSTFRYATLVVAVSNFTQKRIVDMGVDENRVKVVPNGLSLDYIRQAPSFSKDVCRASLSLDGHIILQVGRLVPRKGHKFVFEALPTIKSTLDQPIRFVIVGSGPYREELEQKASQMGVRDNVTFTGFIPDAELHCYYAASDIVVMPAFNPNDRGDVEGFGIVYLEAYAHGKPVIGARAGGVPDAIVHRETGLLVPPGDPNALEESVLYLLKNPSEARMMGIFGQKLVNTRWNWNVLYKEFLL
jgi:phosphatidylinositol alpha-1,6-mannosyltransferase